MWLKQQTFILTVTEAGIKTKSQIQYLVRALFFTHRPHMVEGVRKFCGVSFIGHISESPTLVT